MIIRAARLRFATRRVLVFCLFAACLVWFHLNTSISSVERVIKAAKASAEWAGVQEWVVGYQESMRTLDTDHLSLSHPLDNTCQYPVLYPDDENIQHVTKHIRLHICKKVQPDILTFDYDRGELIFDRELADRLFNDSVRCEYRSFTGGIRPRIMDTIPTSKWKTITTERTPIEQDLIETKCTAPARLKYKTIGPKNDIEVFKSAFGHIVKRNTTTSTTTGNKTLKYIKNDERTLNIDMLFLDSTALNAMRRHMPKTWKYMKEQMGFYHLEGYTKVGDNSMVNLMPILAGLRYGGQAPNMPTEVPDNRVIEAEPLPFWWKLFRERGCSTMFNDDIGDYTRGFFNYPWTHFKGFVEYPTDHFTRPWHLHHRRYPINGSSKYCFGNNPYYVLQLRFLEQMIKKYQDTCHFSFNFITDLPHDDPNNLEMADERLYALLERLYTGDYLNNTILIIAGDHGNRIGYVMYTYIGRIEERMSLFSVYFPEWYRRAHPEAMRQFAINRHRLTSNYDVYRTLREIFNNTLSRPVDPPITSNIAASRAISLFRPIPRNRTCTDANIPPPHCVCLEPVPSWSPSSKFTLTDPVYRQAKELLLNWTRLQLGSVRHVDCIPVKSIDILSSQILTTNQMVQHGVRDLSPEQTKKLIRKLDGDIEYIQLVYKMMPTKVTARTRLQYYKKFKKRLIINIEPYLVEEGIRTQTINGTCSTGNTTSHQIPWFCKCSRKS